MRKSFRIGAVAVAGVATLAIAPGAMAHHCYKTEWQEAAYAQVRSGTPWMPMTEFVGVVISQFPGATPECLAHAGEWTQAWLTANDVDAEPLIHMRATAGGGAHDRNGKELPSISYLDDDDFGFLVGQIFSEADCAGIEFPEMH
ncbi:hypothetical protein [Isoptericola variabilis]|uniref:Lipoprotein n=1 Tax=Isoptericola variabilis (strain 225) TaxID=743718 RepID=F6FWA2_ISOV2|nr:hypothetical protein [Isoptericola variabilis]AEG45646.1 hypothetical protein Isova_2964 [Isoptericola variabilis 225]TWH28808.1 hypothetical protein L600_003700000030 [Isoptericola variabilis J7]